MTLDELKKRRRELGYSYRQLSELSGVPVGTIQKIFGGMTTTPRHATLQALEKVLAPDNGSNSSRYIIHGDSPEGAHREGVRNESAHPGSQTTHSMYSSAGDTLQEPLALYNAKEQGEYTIDDYIHWPEDQRIELIDGRIYVMSAPRITHQQILREMLLQLQTCIEEHHPECQVLFAPVDVQLDGDDRTMVQPDLIILCTQDKMTPERIVGAPDFVAEILSPSTRKKDLLIKSAKYQEAGVKEYWIVDPDDQWVMVYDFRENIEIQIYTFDHEVEVRISGGTCSVDFRRIRDRIR